MITAEYKRYLGWIALLGSLALVGGLVAVVAVHFNNELLAVIGFIVLVAGVMAAAVLIVVGQFRYGKQAIADGLSAARDLLSKDRR